MTLIKRVNSKFWYVQFQFDHRTIVRSTRTTDRKSAERIAAKLRIDAVNDVVLGETKPLTLVEALDHWIESKAGTPNHRNLAGHRAAILRHVAGTIALTKVTPAVFEQFRRGRLAERCGPQTIKHGINVIAGAMRLAKRDGFAVADIHPPTIKLPNGRLRYLSIEEERRLLGQLDPNRIANGLPLPESRSANRTRALHDNHDLVVILLDTGARYGEIANLRWDQVDLANDAIRLWRSKVGNESVIFMTKRVRAIFERRHGTQHGDWVFANKQGKARGYSAIAIRKAIRRAGLSDCTIHTLRHTHATRLIQNGLSVYEVKEVLGHSDIRTTMRYAHLEQAAVTAKARDVIDRIGREAC